MFFMEWQWKVLRLSNESLSLADNEIGTTSFGLFFSICERKQKPEEDSGFTILFYIFFAICSVYFL